jgi:HEXXH motif-containing protein
VCALSNFADTVRSAILGPGPRWFDGLTPVLARRHWAKLARTGVRPQTYTSGAAAGAASEVVFRIASDGSDRSGGKIAVEFFLRGLPLRWARLGLAQPQLAADELVSITPTLRGGLATLAFVPGASRTVAALVKSIVPLGSPSPEHDVHYSDPELPFSIFVGVHSAPSSLGPLRLAETILHESMHLQLTFIEHELPLICGEDHQTLSPWQQTERPARGILHGLYVFRAIEDFMVAVAQERADYDRNAHCTKRIATIRNEIARLEGFDASPDLTLDGQQFAASLLRS